MKTPVAIRWLSWAVACLAIVLAVLALALSILLAVQLGNQANNSSHDFFGPLTAIIYTLVGLLVTPRHLYNPIGWIFCAEGFLLGLIEFASSIVAAHQAGILAIPGVEIALWLTIWIWVPATLLPLTFLLLLFPDGHLPTRRWRPVAYSAALGIILYSLGVGLHPNPSSTPDPTTNPFGIPGAGDFFEFVLFLSLPFLAIGTFGSVAAVVIRFRRSSGIEREQMKWFAYAGILALSSLLVSGIFTGFWPGDVLIYNIAIFFIQGGLDIVAIGAGIAILRYHLYNIDILINRTLVYGALSACVVGLYVLLVGSLGTLFQSSGNFGLALLATGLAALLAQPLRVRLQRSVNRLMYGERDDPYTVLSQLGQQLKLNLEPEAVLPTIIEAVAHNLKLPYVALALKQGNQFEIVASYGTNTAKPVQFPLIYQADIVGQLLVAQRMPGEAFNPAEKRLLEDIALQASAAAHALRLTADLKRARERLVTTREEERRRLRRDLHDGLGPQLASFSLIVAAVRQLLPYDPKGADTLLQELAGQSQAAITDIRRLVYALRPPVLDDLGFIPALCEQGERYSHSGCQVTIKNPGYLPALPAAVEVAAFRIVQEALTNVTRHAHATSCVVSLVFNQVLAGLEVEIKDDGVGLPEATRNGVGLTSMHERAVELGGTCKVESLLGHGTTIFVRLPVHQESNQYNSQGTSLRPSENNVKEIYLDSGDERLWNISAS